MLLWFIFLFCCGIGWIGFEMWRAPLVDRNDNIIKPGKKLSDLFKKKKN